MEAIRVLNTEQQDAIQKATIVVDVQVQKPATDLEGVKVVTGDVSMNNSVIATNIDATKKATDAAISTKDVVKAEEAATDATKSAIQATSNAQTALQNADAAKKLLDQAAAKSVTGDNDEVKRATLVAEQAAQQSAEAKDKAIKATEAAKHAEKNVMKISAGTVPADYTMLYVGVGGLLLVVGMAYYLKKSVKSKASRSYYM